MVKPLILALLLALVPSVGAERAAGPAVAAVDPPSWFLGHPIDRIQLLVRGTGLQESSLVSRTDAVGVLSSRSNDRGTYLIAEVAIGRDARAGSANLVVESRGGSAPVAFALRERLTSGFAGLADDDVIYMVVPDRFADGDTGNNTGNFDRGDPWKYHGGDFRGLESKLGYLKDLGITAIWMGPVYDNDDVSGSYHGYHVTDFYGVEEHFGTPDDLQSLVRTAHSMGIKVITDQIANHSGPSHAWLSDPPTATWFNGTPETHLANVFKIESVLPGGSAKERRATLDGWFGDHLPDLNQSDPECARYLIQNSVWWLESYGFDVIRQDTLPYVPREFVRDWTSAIKGSRPRVDFLGEVLIGNEKVLPYFQGGSVVDGVDNGVDALFDFPISFAVKEYVEGLKPAERVAQVQRADTEYSNAGLLISLVDNHDMHRYLTTLNGDRRKAMMAQTLLYSLRGGIQLYYGEEIGLEGGRDPDNRRDFPGGFSGDVPSAFAQATRTREQRAHFDHLGQLLRLRREHPALTGPRTTMLLASGVQLAYLRESRDDFAIVVANVGPVERLMELSLPRRLSATLTDGMGALGPMRVVNGRATIRVPAKSAAIFVRAKDVDTN